MKTPSPANRSEAAEVPSSDSDQVFEDALSNFLNLPRPVFKNLREKNAAAEFWHRTRNGIVWTRRGAAWAAESLRVDLPAGLPFTASQAEQESPPPAEQAEPDFPHRATITRVYHRNSRLISATLETGERVKVRIDPAHMTPRPYYSPGMEIGVRFLRSPNLYATRKPRRPGKW